MVFWFVGAVGIGRSAITFARVRHRFEGRL